jgi:hypothetical protein
LKTGVNVPTKVKRKKLREKKIIFDDILSAKLTKKAGSGFGAGSVPKYHGSATLPETVTFGASRVLPSTSYKVYSLKNFKFLLKFCVKIFF